MNYHLDEQPDVDSLSATVRKGIAANDPPDVGLRDWQPLHMALRDDAGTVVGGVYGATMWRWLMVDGLWVSPTLREQGLGRRLLLAAEAEAMARGCVGSSLSAFDFGARDFYLHLGYEVVGILPGFPPGHTQYRLSKTLAPPGP